MKNIFMAIEVIEREEKKNLKQKTIFESYHIHRKSNKFEIDGILQIFPKKRVLSDHILVKISHFSSPINQFYNHIVINKSKFQLAKKKSIADHFQFTSLTFKLIKFT